MLESRGDGKGCLRAKSSRLTNRQTDKKTYRQTDKANETQQNADPTEAPNAGRVGRIENYVVSVGARRQIKTQEPGVGGHCNIEEEKYIGSGYSKKKNTAQMTILYLIQGYESTEENGVC